MTLTIYAVGDIMLGEPALCYNFGVKSIIKNKGVDYLFKDIKDILNPPHRLPFNYTNKKGFEARHYKVQLVKCNEDREGR